MGEAGGVCPCSAARVPCPGCAGMPSCAGALCPGCAGMLSGCAGVPCCTFFHTDCLPYQSAVSLG